MHTSLRSLLIKRNNLTSRLLYSLLILIAITYFRFPKIYKWMRRATSETLQRNIAYLYIRYHYYLHGSEKRGTGLFF